MADKQAVHVGDKFVLEIEEVEWHPIKGNRYYVKGFDSMMLTDYGISKLTKYEEPPKEQIHSCGWCKHQYKGEYEMPCVLCDKNGIDHEARDMFEADGK